MWGAPHGRVAVHLREHVLPRQARVGAEALDHAAGPGQAGRAGALEQGREGGVRRVVEVGEQVHRDAALEAADLDAGEDTDSETFSGGDRLGPAGGGVVVGEGHDVQARGCCGGDDLRGLLRAVGGVGVRVQVDAHQESLRPRGTAPRTRRHRLRAPPW
jgi:hypothetical protein